MQYRAGEDGQDNHEACGSFDHLCPCIRMLIHSLIDLNIVNTLSVMYTVTMQLLYLN